MKTIQAPFSPACSAPKHRSSSLASVEEDEVLDTPLDSLADVGASKSPVFVCDYGCGFSGVFDLVAKHEEICAWRHQENPKKINGASSGVTSSIDAETGHPVKKTKDSVQEAGQPEKDPRTSISTDGTYRGENRSSTARQLFTVAAADSNITLGETDPTPVKSVRIAAREGIVPSDSTTESKKELEAKQQLIAKAEKMERECAAAKGHAEAERKARVRAEESEEAEKEKRRDVERKLKTAQAELDAMRWQLDAIQQSARGQENNQEDGGQKGETEQEQGLTLQVQRLEEELEISRATSTTAKKELEECRMALVSRLDQEQVMSLLMTELERAVASAEAEAVQRLRCEGALSAAERACEHAAGVAERAGKATAVAHEHLVVLRERVAEARQQATVEREKAEEIGTELAASKAAEAEAKRRVLEMRGRERELEEALHARAEDLTTVSAELRASTEREKACRDDAERAAAERDAVEAELERERREGGEAVRGLRQALAEAGEREARLLAEVEATSARARPSSTGDDSSSSKDTKIGAETRTALGTPSVDPAAMGVDKCDCPSAVVPRPVECNLIASEPACLPVTVNVPAPWGPVAALESVDSGEQRASSYAESEAALSPGSTVSSERVSDASERVSKASEEVRTPQACERGGTPCERVSPEGGDGSMQATPRRWRHALVTVHAEALSSAGLVL